MEPMKLIKRQDIIVSVATKLENTKFQNPGLKSRAVRKLMEFNAKRMQFAGYTKDEATESFRQCMDMARLNLIGG